MLEEINKTHFSPYQIFIKGGFKMTDKEIFELLGLRDYKLIIDEQEKKTGDLHKRYLFLTEDESWTHIMDDWFYTLWHDKEIRERIKLFSEKFEIFTSSVGDIDDSFDFTYFKEGKAIREYVVKDCDFKGGAVVKDFGCPFPIEKIALSKKKVDQKVMTIINSLGIKTKHDKDKIRIYGKFKNDNE